MPSDAQYWEGEGAARADEPVCGANPDLRSSRSWWSCCILGILAAVAIPSFFNQRDKGRDAQAKVAARTAQTAAETIATDNGGSYNGPSGVTVAVSRAWRRPSKTPT